MIVDRSHLDITVSTLLISYRSIVEVLQGVTEDGPIAIDPPRGNNQPLSSPDRGADYLKVTTQLRKKDASAPARLGECSGKPPTYLGNAAREKRRRTEERVHPAVGTGSTGLGRVEGQRQEAHRDISQTV